jgi:hypothetical protein
MAGVFPAISFDGIVRWVSRGRNTPPSAIEGRNTLRYSALRAHTRGMVVSGVRLVRFS